MNYGPGSSKGDCWVCPDDRQLRLRATLQTGWSVKAGQLSRSTKLEPLDDAEQAKIQEVIQRAEALENMEAERVGRLVERVHNMKRNVTGGDTSNACALCGDRFLPILGRFGLFGAKPVVCNDCKKCVCTKCGLETVSVIRQESIWLCKICSETREMWKKTNAWFFKGLPKYTIPKKTQPEKLAFNRRPLESIKPPAWSLNIAQFQKSSEDYSSSDEEDQTRRSRFKQMMTSSSSREEPSSSSSSSMEEPHTDEVEAGMSGSWPRVTEVEREKASGEGEEHEEEDEETASEKSPSLKSMDIFTAISEFTSIANVSDTEQPIVIPNRKLATGGSTMTETLSQPCVISGGSTMTDTQAQTSAMPISFNPIHRDRITASPSSVSDDPNVEQVRAHHSSMCNGTLDIRRDSTGTLTESTGTFKRPIMTEEIDGFIPNFDTNLGIVDVTVTYDSTTYSLHVALHSAKGLTPMDIHGTADPFCKLNLVPLTKTSHRLRTNTCWKTINPEFNENLTFYSVSETDLSLQSLHILILDDDLYGHDFLGEARFPLNRLRPHISRHLSLNLCGHYAVPRQEEVWGEEECWQHGKIFLTLYFSTRKKALIVNIVKCVNLIPMDSNGFSDPYVKVTLRPDPYKQKFKTSVKWKSLNPIFNEEFALETKINELSRQSLVVTVWDKDYGKSNDFLGCLELCCNSKGERLRHWVDVMKFPDHKHECLHNLSGKPL
uniref:Double C2-like domain-containing protein beta n=1 Tax=Cacopsylla melanoneura TaxID=428564 RepID=A0A8D8PPI8_9HEMI